MLIGSQLTNDNGRNSNSIGNEQSNFSKFVDRVNAQRFKALVGGARNDRSDRPKLGIPFAFERPEAAAAHREFEKELKPAARNESTGSNFSAYAFSDQMASGISTGRFALTMIGVCGVMCAYALARSFK